MALNTYIGARYVPKIVGEWTNTVAYEPLSVVLWQGNSYTSVCAVPVGVDISDENYWVISGNYNAQVEQYRKEVVDLNGNVVKISDDVNKLDGEVTSLSGSVSENTSAITGLTSKTDVIRSDVNTLTNSVNKNTSDISKNTNDISVINEKLSTVSERQYIFLSDSYGLEELPDGRNYADLIARLASISTYYNFNRGSCSFYSTNNTLKFLTLLKDNMSAIEDKNSITDVWVVGGANDVAQTLENTTAAIKEFCVFVKENFPNAIVSLACVGLTFSASTNGRRIGISVPAWKRGAAYGARYIVNSEYILEVSNLLKDTVHPSSNGLNVLAWELAKSLESGIADVYHNYAMTSTSNNMPDLTSVFASSIERRNGVVTFNGLAAGISFTIQPKSGQYVIPANTTMEYTLNVSLYAGLGKYDGGSDLNPVGLVSLYDTVSFQTYMGIFYMEGTVLKMKFYCPVTVKNLMYGLFTGTFMD